MPHHNLLVILLCLSTHLSSLPVRSSAHCIVRLQPYLTSTQTYINLNKLPPAYITFTARSQLSPTHLSLLTATLLLCGGYPTQSRSHPPCKPPNLHPQYSLYALTPNMLPHSTTLPTTTNLTSSHLLTNGFVAPQHLPSKSTPHLPAALFSLLPLPHQQPI